MGSLYVARIAFPCGEAGGLTTARKTPLTRKLPSRPRAFLSLVPPAGVAWSVVAADRLSRHRLIGKGGV